MSSDHDRCNGAAVRGRVGTVAGFPTAGIPRLPNGKPNLTAAAPRTSDGKPDFSGIWALGKTTVHALPKAVRTPILDRNS